MKMKMEIVKKGEMVKGENNNNHYKDWVFFTPKEKKYWKKKFRKFWSRKGIFTPFLFDGDSSKVEVYILNKFPKHTRNVISQMEVAVKNPANCFCCEGVNGEPPPYVELKDWNKITKNFRITDEALEGLRGIETNDNPYEIEGENND